MNILRRSANQFWVYIQYTIYLLCDHCPPGENALYARVCVILKKSVDLRVACLWSDPNLYS